MEEVSELESIELKNKFYIQGTGREMISNARVSRASERFVIAAMGTCGEVKGIPEVACYIFVWSVFDREVNGKDKAEDTE